MSEMQYAKLSTNSLLNQLKQFLTDNNIQVADKLHDELAFE